MGRNENHLTKRKMKLSKRASELIEATKPEQRHLRALLVFAAQNPGFEWCNYSTGDWKRSRAAYLGDSRPVQRQLREIRKLKWRFPGLCDTWVEQAARSTFSGRLSFRYSDKGVAVDYCTGQYWPTEYRKAALAVLKEAIRLNDAR